MNPSLHVLQIEFILSYLVRYKNDKKKLDHYEPTIRLKMRHLQLDQLYPCSMSSLDKHHLLRMLKILDTKEHKNYLYLWNNLKFRFLNHYFAFKMLLTHGIRKVFFAFVSKFWQTLKFEKCFLDSSNIAIPTSTRRIITTL